MDRNEIIRTRAEAALNDVDPVNLFTAVRELAEIRPTVPDEMQLILQTICQRALDGALHEDGTVLGAFYSVNAETFADLIFHLRLRLPEFEVPNGKPTTCTSILLNVVQDEHDAMVSLALDREELDEGTRRRHINLCSLIGNLFVRKLLAAKVVAQVVHGLIGVRGRQPGKQCILYGSELLHVIGKCLDLSGQGNMLMTHFLARLSNLAGSQRLDTREARYPQVVRDVVNSVHERRFRKWPPRPCSQILFRLSELSETGDAKAVRQRLALVNQGGCNLEEEEERFADDAQIAKPFKVVLATTGRECAVIEDMDLAKLDEALVKEAISRWTGIHPNRALVLMPDGESIL